MLFAVFDKDGSGHIDFTEFVKEVMKDTHHVIPNINGSRWFRPSDFRVGASLKFMYPRTGAETQAFEVLSTDPRTNRITYPVVDTVSLCYGGAQHGPTYEPDFK